jgi:hypothetical protein
MPRRAVVYFTYNIIHYTQDIPESGADGANKRPRKGMENTRQKYMANGNTLDPTGTAPSTGRERVGVKTFIAYYVQ